MACCECTKSMDHKTILKGGGVLDTLKRISIFFDIQKMEKDYMLSDLYMEFVFHSKD